MNTITSHKALYSVNKDYFSEIKKVFSSYFKIRLYEALELKRIKENVFLNEVDTDLLGITSIEHEKDLVEAGYIKVDYSDYISSPFNCMNSSEILHTTNYIEYSNIISLEKDFVFKINGTSVLLLSVNHEETILSFEYDVKKIESFIVNQEGFVYIVFKTNQDKLIFIKSHLSLEFFKLNKTHRKTTTIDEIENLLKFEIEDDFKKFVFDDDKGFNYLTKNSKIKRINYGRKLYFEKDDSIFYNVIDSVEIKKTGIVQVEHLHFYDWISILGLNNFVDSDGFKLSTKHIEKFKNIFRFKFDDTLNGALNYYDFYSEKKDYKIDYFQNGIEILGNFKFGNFEHGQYELRINIIEEKINNELLLSLELIKDSKCVKKVFGNTVSRIFYFCNLKFNFVSYTYPNEVFSLNIDVKSNYSVKVFDVVSEVVDNIKTNDFEKLLKKDQVVRNESSEKKQLVELHYKNEFLFIKNYVKSSSERMFEGDLKIRLLEKDLKPSSTWMLLKDRDYFLNLDNKNVKKILKPRREIKPLLKSYTSNFILKIKEDD